MESFIFNNFKYRLLNGDVKNKDTWTFSLVNSKFADDFENKNIKSFDKMNLFYNLQEYKHNIGNSALVFDMAYRTKAVPVYYVYKKAVDTLNAEQPIYVDLKNWAQFIEVYPTGAHLYDKFFVEHGVFYRTCKVAGKTGDYPRGFYYVTTAEELKWCAERVNGYSGDIKTELYDNEINIVLGDNIGTEGFKHNISENKRITFCIGCDPSRPFEGIFYGNGFCIKNIHLISYYNTFGIIGYLGSKGLISGIRVNGTNVIRTNKKINIDHMLNESTDINVGLLCGKNIGGTITDVVFEGKIYYKGFVPGVYAVNNKTDMGHSNAFSYKDVNIHFPNHLCLNSMGNIIPYIGYFATGVVGTYAVNNHPTYGSKDFWNNKYAFSGMNSEFCPYDMEGLTDMPCYSEVKSSKPTDIGENGVISAHVLWYDGEQIDAANDIVKGLYNNADDYLWNLDLLKTTCSNLITGGENITRNIEVGAQHYLDAPMKMHQFNRASYNTGALCGYNSGKISNISMDVSAVCCGTYVGFMGGIAGKQIGKGQLLNACVNFTLDDDSTRQRYRSQSKDLYEEKTNSDGSFLLFSYVSQFKINKSIFNSDYWAKNSSLLEELDTSTSCIGGYLNKKRYVYDTNGESTLVSCKYLQTPAIILELGKPGNETIKGTWVTSIKYGSEDSVKDFVFSHTGQASLEKYKDTSYITSKETAPINFDSLKSYKQPSLIYVTQPDSEKVPIKDMTAAQALATEVLGYDSLLDTDVHKAVNSFGLIPQVNSDNETILEDFNFVPMSYKYVAWLATDSLDNSTFELYDGTTSEKFVLANCNISELTAVSDYFDSYKVVFQDFNAAYDKYRITKAKKFTLTVIHDDQTNKIAHIYTVVIDKTLDLQKTFWDEYKRLNGHDFDMPIPRHHSKNGFFGPTMLDINKNYAPVFSKFKSSLRLTGCRNYNIQLRSIKNAGALFGSLVLKDNLKITSVSACFNNNIMLPYNKKGDVYTPIYRDYAFENRFGTVAGVCELNSAYISDKEDLEGLIDIKKYVDFSFVTLGYVEKNNYTTSNISYFNTTTRRPTENNRYPCGAASTFIGEIKPVLLTNPVYNQSPISNMRLKSYTTYEDLSLKDKQTWIYERKGLFTIDQPIAAPTTDPNYWSINVSVDMPGIRNCINHSNNDYCDLFDMVYSGYNDKDGKGFLDRLFSFKSVKIAGPKDIKGNICWAYFPVRSQVVRGQQQVSDDYKLIPSYTKNKLLSRYPYFGSSLDCFNYEYSNDNLPISADTILSINNDRVGEVFAYLDTAVTNSNEIKSCNETKYNISAVWTSFKNPTGDLLKNMQNADSILDGTDVFKYNYDIIPQNSKAFSAFKYDVELAENGNMYGFNILDDEQTTRAVYENDQYVGWAYKYWNDDFVYDGKVVHMGLHLSEECIISNLIQYSIVSAYGISGNDIDGLFVTDSSNKPVMYIKLDMGDCNGSQSWSYPCSGDVSGVFMEIK